ncbi:tRNA sulfurtransferase [Candidatus Terasakiella magnetica]|uniref:tRNA sulfurtransferase n=1 Tax=Candidatus Terasakiella magnetica TaxID=1867952 RepID=A0A1C3RC99_9PROT|nr:tRNA uracil 4-sulfurtransferase ThiI [Candidatus Terasakiella magnetica]SCA54842.1 tRNA sulfurtransferase [Candidatus Terasakiella magnetica]
MEVSTRYPHVIIIRLAPEMMLKAPATRKKFQKALRSNMQEGLERAGIEFDIIGHEGRMQVHTSDQEKALDVISRTFGVASYSPIDKIIDGGLEAHKEAAVELYKELVTDKTYAVRIKRLGNKKKFTSVEMERHIGGCLRPFAKKVDLDNPEVMIKADVAGDLAYFYTQKIAGPGGFPIGIQGNAITLISGGFDSVVAAWYLMKRGAMNDFVFCNLAGGAYERMVVEITKVLCDRWATGTRPKLYCIDFEPVINDLRANTAPEWWQVILKRQMYRAGCEIAKRIGADALVTGEALGQVSSQTLSNLNTIDEVSDIPVLRPLIGFDKEQIIKDARMIGTDKLSEKIPEYCALNKRRPAVKSGRNTIAKQETKMDFSVLTDMVEGCKIYDMFDVTDEDIAQHSVFIEEIPEKAIIIDCQPESLYDDWHVAGAKNYTAGKLMNSLRELKKTQPYVLYCPFGTQSAVLAERMQKAGYEAYSYKGGIKQLKRMFPNGAELDEE